MVGPPAEEDKEKAILIEAFGLLAASGMVRHLAHDLGIAHISLEPQLII